MPGKHARAGRIAVARVQRRFPSGANGVLNSTGGNQRGKRGRPPLWMNLGALNTHLSSYGFFYRLEFHLRFVLIMVKTDRKASCLYFSGEIHTFPHHLAALSCGIFHRHPALISKPVGTAVPLDVHLSDLKDISCSCFLRRGGGVLTRSDSNALAVASRMTVNCHT